MPAPSNTSKYHQRGMWLNDFDLTRIGFIVDNTIDRHRAGLSFPDRTTALPGRVGTIALAREFESSPRRLVVQGTQISASSSQLMADAADFKRRAYNGNVEIRFSDDPNIMYLGRCDDWNATLISPGLRNTGRRTLHQVRVSFLCQDPLGYDRYGSVVSFSTAKAECPLGSASSLPLIRVFGPSTGSGFTLTYRDHAGNSEATFGFSGAAAVMSSTEYISIDMETASITHSDGTNLVSVLSTASTFFALEPQDAAGSTGPWPTVEINATGVTGDILYRKAYL